MRVEDRRWRNEDRKPRGYDSPQIFREDTVERMRHSERQVWKILERIAELEKELVEDLKTLKKLEARHRLKTRR